MEKHIKERYHDGILTEARGRFGVDESKIKLLDGFESFIYEFEKGGAEFILRIGHSSHRTENQVNAELDWVNYLSDGGVGVARAVPSENGKLVESIDAGDGTQFLASAFVKAPGTHIPRAERKGEILTEWGRQIGRIHRLTKDYKPSRPEWRRNHWHEEIGGWEKYLPADQTLVTQRFLDLCALLRTYPTGRDEYGLIHTDAHAGNFFVHDGRITLFDFDDSAYIWFISDIAIVIFYMVMYPLEGMSREDYGRHILKYFMPGYNEENRLDDIWMKRLPEFLKLREFELYLVIYRSFDIDNLDAWCANYMNGRREKLENETPFLDIDFLDY